MGMRVRLYGTERLRKERMIGESVVGFASINQDTETTHWLTLEPRSNLSVSTLHWLTLEPRSHLSLFEELNRQSMTLPCFPNNT